LETGFSYLLQLFDITQAKYSALLSSGLSVSKISFSRTVLLRPLPPP
jgi:hypothetical protein